MTTTFAHSPSTDTQHPAGLHDHLDQRSTDEAATTRLFAIERTARDLWAIEPQCDAADRTLLMTRLTAVTRRVDQLVFRQQFHRHEPIDQHELGRCEQHLGALAARWTRRRSDSALAA